MAAARSDLLTRVGSAIVLFAIAGIALWFGGIAFGLLLLVGGALLAIAASAKIHVRINAPTMIDPATMVPAMIDTINPRRRTGAPWSR